ncbi:hypothetical protein ACU6U9_07090 [Pseudomonas sp. HK3]
MKNISLKDRVECEWLYYFSKFSGIFLSDIKKTEQPDFIVEVGGKKIGVELTQAHRSLNNSKLKVRQVEVAQEKFSKDIFHGISPHIPLEVSFSYINDIAVDSIEEDKKSIIQAINEVSRLMTKGEVRRLVNYQECKLNEDFCSVLPSFLESIQLLNGGQETSQLTSSRILLLESFTEKDLHKILKSKHEKLKNYCECDEQWLVITSGYLPGSFNMEMNLVSQASVFSGIDLSLPISTDFNRVYFYQWPSDISLLSG